MQLKQHIKKQLREKIHLTISKRYTMPYINRLIIKNAGKFPKELNKAAHITFNKMAKPINITSQVGDYEAISAIIKQAFPTNDNNLVNLYQAQKTSKEIAEENNHASYLSRFILENLVDSDLLDGQILRSKNKVVDSKLNIDQVRAWTIFIGTFDKLVEKKIFKQSPASKNIYTFNLNDLKNGKTLTSNKANNIVTSIKSFVDILPETSKSDFAKLIGL